MEHLQRLEGNLCLDDQHDNDASLVAKPTAVKLLMRDRPEVRHWTGPANINGEDREIYSGLERLHYHVVVLTWRSVQCDWNSTDRMAVSQPNAGSAMSTRNGYPTVQWKIIRDMMTRGGEFDICPKPNQEWYTTVDQAHGVEAARRRMFLKAFADVEAKRIAVEWESKCSLLKFES